MRISRHSSTQSMPTYFLNNVSLPPTDCYKYLGVNITSNLSWDIHIEYVTSNASRMLGYLRRNFSTVPSTVKLMLYKTLVRSKLEYACAIWDPSQSSLIITLEAVQNRAARFILSNYSRHSSVTSMKRTLNLPDLSLRRKCSRLNLFHKIYHYNQVLKLALFSPPCYVSARTDHLFKVSLPLCRTNLYHDSFVPRTSAEWNHLPSSIAAIADAERFKIALENAL